MSQIAPVPHREPVENEPRKMSPARRARIIAAHKGHCAYLGCEETKGLEVDHFIPLAIGGKDADTNLRPLCSAHHKLKTALDRKIIAKANRLIKKADPEQRKPSQIQSRGFDKSRSRSFSGKVRAREARA